MTLLGADTVMARKEGEGILAGRYPRRQISRQADIPAGRYPGRQISHWSFNWSGVSCHGLARRSYRLDSRHRQMLTEWSFRYADEIVGIGPADSVSAVQYCTVLQYRTEQLTPYLPSIVTGSGSGGESRREEEQGGGGVDDFPIWRRQLSNLGQTTFHSSVERTFYGVRRTFALYLTFTYYSSYAGD